MIRLCPYRIITNKITVEPGNKISTQEFCPCILEQCAAYNSAECTCERTRQKVSGDNDE